MASSWGLSWGFSWANAWGSIDTGGGGSGSSSTKKTRKKRQKVKLSDIWALKQAPDEKISQIRTITPQITPPKKVWTLDGLNLTPLEDISKLQREIALLRSESNDKALAQKELELLRLEDEEALELILLTLRIDESVILG